MNIIFLTVSNIETLDKGGIYPDLMRKFRDEGHHVYIVSPTERRYGKSSYLINEKNTTILKVKTLNVQKTNVIEKGIATLLLNRQYLRAIKKYLKGVTFDLILYSTPPITLTSAISTLKKKQKAKTYLLLKDIFPQNAIDIGLMKKGILYRYFRSKEKRLYSISDHIGCMSPANVDYLIKHNPGLDRDKVEVNPNSIDPVEINVSNEQKERLYEKYDIPKDRCIFMYGGNLGKPQGIEFLLEMLKANAERTDSYFLIVGTGTEYPKIDAWFRKNKPSNAKLMTRLPKEEYDTLLSVCHVGLIFLDKRFSIPNYPSRLLPYLLYNLPVIAITDNNTDIGRIAEKNGYGISVLHGDIDQTNRAISLLAGNSEKREKMARAGYSFLINNYTSSHSFNIITKHFSEHK